MHTVELEDFDDGIIPPSIDGLRRNQCQSCRTVSRSCVDSRLHICHYKHSIMFGQGCFRWLVLVLEAYSNIWPTISQQRNMIPETEYCRTCDASRATPYCDRPPTEQEQQAPGIGIALDMAHATAVVRFHDGSYQNVAFIEGDPPYIHTMASMANADYQLKMNNDSRTVVAGMVEKLRIQVEAALDGAVTAAAVTIPDQISLPYEEFVAILDLASIQNVMHVDDSFDTISTIGAAYAGAAMGLCKDYDDYYKCERQERCFRLHDVLQVDLSAKSLSATIWEGGDSYKRQFIGRTFVDTILGIDYRARLDAKTGQEYFRDVRLSLRDFVESFRPRNITYLILTGTEATHPTFQSSLRDVLKETVINSKPQDGRQMLEAMDTSRLDRVHLWQTARGAAEIAKRRQEGPFMCRPDHSGEKRKQMEYMLKNLETNSDFRAGHRPHSFNIDPLEEEEFIDYSSIS